MGEKTGNRVGHVVVALVAVLVLILAWIASTESAEARTLDTGKFCIGASGYGGEFKGKSGVCDSAPSVDPEVITGEVDVQYACGNTNFACGNKFTLVVAGLPAKAELSSKSELTINGESFMPVQSGDTLTWTVEKATTESVTGRVVFSVTGTELQLHKIEATLIASPLPDGSYAWVRVYY